jgi:hypothetical protein
MIERLALAFAFLALAGSTPPSEPTPDGPDFQSMISPASQQFAAKADRLCPQAHLRFVTPGDLDWDEEGFDAALSRAERRRETLAIPRSRDGSPARCAQGPGGLSCPSQANLEAIRRAGLIDRFTGFACTHGLPRHRSDRDD